MIRIFLDQCEFAGSGRKCFLSALSVSNQLLHGPHMSLSHLQHSLASLPRQVIKRSGGDNPMLNRDVSMIWASVGGRVAVTSMHLYRI